MDRFTTLLICGGVLLFLWITVLGLIFSDLWAGVRKAKKAGVYRTSDGYKKTIDKMARYYNMMLPAGFVILPKHQYVMTVVFGMLEYWGTAL